MGWRSHARPNPCSSLRVTSREKRSPHQRVPRGKRVPSCALSARAAYLVAKLSEQGTNLIVFGILLLFSWTRREDKQDRTRRHGREQQLCKGTPRKKKCMSSKGPSRASHNLECYFRKRQILYRQPAIAVLSDVMQFNSTVTRRAFITHQANQVLLQPSSQSRVAKQPRQRKCFEVATSPK